ncbi:hypothetical protein QYE76_010938 [Lolium multiflorum]|uniref:Uncharacterized protein n=1 Tax=Lolium multiflorum TaxID=4521 RepID=A0AAD8TW05_LOLMU|nr:hypothetical protein QYE76_010938 [Lolium multiflorum]
MLRACPASSAGDAAGCSCEHWRRGVVPEVYMSLLKACEAGDTRDGEEGRPAHGVAFKVRAAEEHELIKCMAGWAKRGTFCSIDMGAHENSM